LFKSGRRGDEGNSVGKKNTRKEAGVAHMWRTGTGGAGKGRVRNALEATGAVNGKRGSGRGEIEKASKGVQEPIKNDSYTTPDM